MSFKSDLAEYHQEIETKYWNLMSYALKKNLCIKLEKHLDHNKREVLQVKIFPIDKKPDCLHGEFSYPSDDRLYYSIKRFVDEFENDSKEIK